MPAHKTHNAENRKLDAQLEEIVHYLNNPECPELPTYADNATAAAAGLAVGRFYKTVTGELRIVV